MAIELDGVRVTTTMRTPGDDFELAVGFCHAEGLLAGHRVQTVRYCASGSAVATGFNIVSVSTGGAAPAPVRRLTTTTSSCGFCGSDEIDELAADLDTVGGPLVEWATLAAAPDGLRAAQALFDDTGAVHAAGVVEPGRHGLDGARRRRPAQRRRQGGGPPAARRTAPGLGARAGGERPRRLRAGAQGVGGGVTALVAVGAPTALAVATAERAGMQLAGLPRDGELTVYTTPPPDL